MKRENTPECHVLCHFPSGLANSWSSQELSRDQVLKLCLPHTSRQQGVGLRGVFCTSLMANWGWRVWNAGFGKQSLPWGLQSESKALLAVSPGCLSLPSSLTRSAEHRGGVWGRGSSPRTIPGHSCSWPQHREPSRAPWAACAAASLHQNLPLNASSPALPVLELPCP